MHRTLRRLAITTVMAAVLPLSLLAGATAASASVPPQAAKPMGLLIASELPEAGDFNIHNANAPGKCIGIDTNGLAGDWNCTANRDQVWTWAEALYPGWQQLVNLNGQCLGVQGGSEAVGARIVAWSCLGTGHPDQYWQRGRAAYGGNELNNYQAYSDPNTPAQLAGVAGGSTANGAPVILWYEDDTQNQFWY